MLSLLDDSIMLSNECCTCLHTPKARKFMARGMLVRVYFDFDCGKFALCSDVDGVHVYTS